MQINAITDLSLRKQFTGPDSICNDIPAARKEQAFRSGNGTIILRDNGAPRNNEVALQHELLWYPQWESAPEAPKVAGILGTVQQMVLDHKFKEASELVDEVAGQNGTPPQYNSSERHDAFRLVFENEECGAEQSPANGIGSCAAEGSAAAAGGCAAEGSAAAAGGCATEGSAGAAECIDEYLHVQHMDTGEVVTHWKENGGTFERRMFVSRADGAAFIYMTAPEGELDVTLRCICPEYVKKTSWIATHNVSGQPWIDGTTPPDFSLCSREDGSILLEGSYAYHQGNYAAAIVPICCDGNISAGTDLPGASVPETSVRISGASACLLAITVDRSRDEGSPVSATALAERLVALKDAVQLSASAGENSCEGETAATIQASAADQAAAADQTTAYECFLGRHIAIHKPVYERVKIDLGGEKEDELLTINELKQKQFMTDHILPAFLEKLMRMGRYFLLCETGQYPPIYGHVNINVNHQIAAGNIGNMPEIMQVWFDWIREMLPEARENARNTLGTRGFLIACHCDEESGRNYHFGKEYPHEFWISSSGWCLQPFLEHYYCTGDEAFRRDVMIPLYEELAELYIDFLTIRDDAGKFIFVPSYSPENFPSNYGWMTAANAVMDITVCREVMETLLVYGADVIDEAQKKAYQEILDSLPPYLYERTGEIKEWSMADYEERHDHRHISQLYGAYPGDEFQPERDAELFRHARITNRLRAMENESCHGVTHRTQIAARLKDSELVEDQLRFFLESGYINENGTTTHNPYLHHEFPDGQGGMPAAVMEALLYARPGFLELLPAADSKSLQQGCISGMSIRSFAVADRLAWDEAHVSLRFTSLREQQIILCYRRGFRNLHVTGAEVLCDDLSGKECQDGIYGNFSAGPAAVSGPVYAVIHVPKGTVEICLDR